MKHDRIVSLRKNSLTSLAFLSHSLRLTPLPPSSAGRWFLSRFAISVGTPLQTTQPERGAIYSGQLSRSLSHNSVSPPLDFKKAFESSASHEHKKRARDFFRRLHRRRRRSLFSNANDHRSGLVSVGGILFLFVIGKASKKFQSRLKSKLLPITVAATSSVDERLNLSLKRKTTGELKR